MLLAALMLHAPPRAAQPSMNFFDDAATWLRSVGADYEADALSPAATEALADITRPDGWRLKCEIGSEVAQRLGGSGTLATGPASSTAALDLRVAFGLDEGYAPPHHPCLIRQSLELLELPPALAPLALGLAPGLGSRPWLGSVLRPGPWPWFGFGTGLRGGLVLAPVSPPWG